jgi:hypothetical protein
VDNVTGSPTLNEWPEAIVKVGDPTVAVDIAVAVEDAFSAVIFRVPVRAVAVFAGVTRV